MIAARTIESLKIQSGEGSLIWTGKIFEDGELVTLYGDAKVMMLPR
jgi:hypothetical protein